MKNLLRRLIGENIDFLLVMDSALGKVKADLGQINQILINLAINARDAMPSGGKLTIETANLDLHATYSDRHAQVPAGSYVILSMSDTGCGMDAETEARIFEPFFTTKVEGKGTGLGLAMVYGTVKQSGGYIWVYSELGKGSKFKIYLPRAHEVEEPVQKSGGPRDSVKGTETVLVIEDEAGVRALAMRILQIYGYNVLESANAEEALQVSERFKQQIDLLLTDVILPKMGGRQIAERLAILRPEMKILFMSGYTDDEVLRNGVLEASSAFLQKPFTPSCLVRKVREVLDSDRTNCV